MSLFPPSSILLATPKKSPGLPVGLQQLALENQLCSPLQDVCPTLGIFGNGD
jgi:hypothetical protein